jgi:hypothetical protein
MKHDILQCYLCRHFLKIRTCEHYSLKPIRIDKLPKKKALQILELIIEQHNTDNTDIIDKKYRLPCYNNLIHIFKEVLNTPDISTHYKDKIVNILLIIS